MTEQLPTDPITDLRLAALIKGCEESLDSYSAAGGGHGRSNSYLLSMAFVVDQISALRELAVRRARDKPLPMRDPRPDGAKARHLRAWREQGDGKVERALEAMTAERDRLREALTDTLSCIETLRNDYRMNPDTDELIVRLTAKARAALAEGGD